MTITLKVEDFAGTKFRGCTFQVSLASIKFRGRIFQVNFEGIKFRGCTSPSKFMISFENKKAGRVW